MAQNLDCDWRLTHLRLARHNVPIINVQVVATVQSQDFEPNHEVLEYRLGLERHLAIDLVVHL